jgi:hypothetical protein
MKILHVYRSAPSETTKKLVEIVSEGRDNENFDLNVDNLYTAGQKRGLSMGPLFAYFLHVTQAQDSH